MGSSVPQDQGSSRLRRTSRPEGPIVAFDFDGTLTVKDSFTAFLRWRAQPLTYLIGLVRLIPAGVRYLIDRDRGRIKADAVSVFLKGLSRAELEAEAEAFAKAQTDMLFRPDALEVWRRKKAEGARLVIVTASPDIVVEPFARRLDADVLLGTRLLFDAAGRVAGALMGENCRGEEKVRQLKQAFGPKLQLDEAYGDTSGDLEMLAIARQGYMKLFKGRPSRQRAA